MVFQYQGKRYQRSRGVPFLSNLIRLPETRLEDYVLYILSEKGAVVESSFFHAPNRTSHINIAPCLILQINKHKHNK